MRDLLSQVSRVIHQEPNNTPSFAFLASVSLVANESRVIYRKPSKQTHTLHFSPSTTLCTDFKMERVKIRATKTTASPPDGSQGTKSPREHHSLCERREKMKHTKKTPHPIIHPDVAHAQMEENSLIRFNEDSRPMFSPIPRNHSPDAEGDDSPRLMSGRGARDKTAFPSIHVDKCEKAQRPSYASASPEPACRSPDSDMEVDNEVMSTSHSSSGLNVPSPYMHRKSDGRVVLVTQDSNSGMLSSWSRSEGNLPDAIRRSHSTPGSHTQLLDINRYRPDWHPRPTLRQSSDVALHELRREGQRSPATPRRLTAHLLEPLSLNPGERSVSASHLQSP